MFQKEKTLNKIGLILGLSKTSFEEPGSGLRRSIKTPTLVEGSYTHSGACNLYLTRSRGKARAVCTLRFEQNKTQLLVDPLNKYRVSGFSSCSLH